MEKTVWIRTQDRKKLLLAKYLEVVGSSIFEGEFNCGMYADEASAIRVLDYIQARIQGKVKRIEGDLIKDIDETNIVVEMPKITPPY